MKVGVMASGRGSNFQAIINSGLNGETPNVEIVQLIVNKADAYAIERAKNHGIQYNFIDSAKKSREKFDEEPEIFFKNQMKSNH